MFLLIKEPLLRALRDTKVGTSVAFTIRVDKRKQPEKALLSIFLIVDGKITFSTFSQEAKAVSPISVRVVLSKLI